MIILRWIKRTVAVLDASGLKAWLLRIALLLIALGILGFIVAASGVIPLKASAGHWPITRWFLEFSQRRSISTHSIGIDVPKLDEHGLVVKGAGHYETGCRPCHGSPGVPQPRVAQAMLPMPPDLRVSVSNWSPSELFSIVNHGIKFTGMPAWPAIERDDEVWAVVAFLRRLPGMSATEYRDFALGSMSRTDTALLRDLLPDHTTQQRLFESCGRCHGLDGLGRGLGAFPKLAGQKPDYLSASLVAYAKGERHSGIMGPVAAAMSAESIRELSLFYSGLPNAKPANSELETNNEGKLGDVSNERGSTTKDEHEHEQKAATLEHGQKIVTAGIPIQGVPACIECHGPTSEPRNPIYPVLAGQYADYLVLQLQLFKKGHRGGTPYAGIMRHVANRLTTNDMRAAALYFSTLDGREVMTNDHRGDKLPPVRSEE